MTYPYNDNKMTYNLAEHRYALNPQYVTDKTGIVLQNVLRSAMDNNVSASAERFVDFISRHFYGYIYRNIPTANRNIIEYALAKCPELRDIIAQCMVNEVEYALSEGGFWNKSGVNIAKGSVMDLSTLRDTRVVSYDTQSLLWSPVPSLPYPIMYRGIIATLRTEWRTDY